MGDIMGDNARQGKPAPLFRGAALTDAPYAVTPLGDGPPLGRFAALDALDGFAHAVTTRRGPLAPLASDHPDTAVVMAALARRLGLHGAAWCRQVHGDRVRRAAAPGWIGEGDALVTATPGLMLAGFSADCPLVLAAGRGRDGAPAVGLAHASWRATVRGITGAMAAALARDFGVDPAGITAAVCPSAGPCCYEVGAEVRDEATARLGARAAAFFPERDGRLFFDLWAANADALARAGVPAGAVHVAAVCTLCRNADYPSYRVEGERASRFLGAIGVL